MMNQDELERAKRVAQTTLGDLQRKYTFTAPVEQADIKHVYAELREAWGEAFRGTPCGVEVYEQDMSGSTGGTDIVMSVWLYGPTVPGGLCILHTTRSVVV